MSNPNDPLHDSKVDDFVIFQSAAISIRFDRLWKRDKRISGWVKVVSTTTSAPVAVERLAVKLVMGRDEKRTFEQLNASSLEVDATSTWPMSGFCTYWRVNVFDHRLGDHEAEIVF